MMSRTRLFLTLFTLAVLLLVACNDNATPDDPVVSPTATTAVDVPVDSAESVPTALLGEAPTWPNGVSRRPNEGREAGPARFAGENPVEPCAPDCGWPS